MGKAMEHCPTMVTKRRYKERPITPFMRVVGGLCKKCKKKDYYNGSGQIKTRMISQDKNKEKLAEGTLNVRTTK